MELKDRIKSTLEYIDKHIEECKEKSVKSESQAMSYYYDGLVVAFENCKCMLEFNLKESE